MRPFNRLAHARPKNTIIPKRQFRPVHELAEARPSKVHLALMGAHFIETGR